MNTDQLRSTFLFEACSDEQLAWLVAHSQVVELPAGASLFEEGGTVDALWVLLHGETQVSRTLNGRRVALETSSQPGNWAGWLPMFDQTPMTIGAHTTAPSTLLRIGPDAVRHMLDSGFPITHHLLNGMFYGVQNFEALSRQQEKLAALGKLSAGLAHELNNPASAARRAAAQLGSSISILQQRLLALGRYELGVEDEGALFAELEQQALERMRRHTPLGSLAQSDREDELATWLERHGVEDAWDAAATLANSGLDRPWLDALAKRLPQQSVGPVAAWLAASLLAHGLTGEIEQSSVRIAELVSSVKSYSSMDQTSMREVDVHEGIENTLTMLRHKLKHGIEVVRRYDRSLPPITVYPGELNQVWTNIIDNAADAMNGEGTLTITTGREDPCLLIEFADTGPGIPADIQSRIFDPFFTTKAQGQGTGLGLDIAYRIITNHHHGEIKLISHPGDTRFRILLPLE